MQSTRRAKASLSPKQRADRGNRWFPRGSWTEFGADGARIERRGWRGGGYATKAECQAECDRLNDAILAAATRARSGIPIFAVAAATYGELKSSRQQLHAHLARAAEVIGDVQCDEVNDAVVLRVVKALYPKGAKPSTLNRHIYTPIIAVLNHAAKDKPWKVSVTRPSGHADSAPADAPEGADWYRAVLPLCSPNLRALVLFVRLHNRRSGEAFRAIGRHLQGDYLEIPRMNTKSRRTSERLRLAEPVLQALEVAGIKGPDDPLFGYRYSTRRNAWRDLDRACRKAGVPMFSLHKAGRHAFSKHHLDQGGSLADLTQLGRWSDPAIPAMLYGAREDTALDARYLPRANDFGRLITGAEPKSVPEPTPNDSFRNKYKKLT